MPFDQVVREHGPRVLRVCRAVLGRSDADEAWAETFLAALRAYPRLPPDADVGAWLATIAHRKCLDLLRREARRPVPVPDVGSGALVGADPSEEPDHAALYAALGRLTERQRLAVAHHHLGGLRYREVAKMIGGTEEAARRAAADGLKNLRRWLVLDVEGDVAAATPTVEDAR